MRRVTRGRRAPATPRSRLITAIVALACLTGASATVVAAQGAPPNTQPASPHAVVHDILDEQGRIWRFPLSVAHAHHWKPVLAITALTAAAVVLDPHEAPYFRRTQTFDGFGRVCSGLNTGVAEGLLPVTFLLTGLIRRDPGTRATGLLAGEALLNAEILSEVMKNVTRRLRPSDLSPTGDFGDTWFRVPGGVLFVRGSFPSGHAIGACAVAGVIARRYRQHRWVPWLAYGLAGVVGFSRITLQSHFPSDVFAGEALGCVIGHDVADVHGS